MALPVRGHGAGRPGDRLIERTTIGRCQRGSFEELLGAVVVEPLLTWLEAPNHGMSGCPVMGARVLAGRVVAAPDLSARRAAAKVQPPARLRAGEALRAPSPTRRGSGVDVARIAWHHGRASQLSYGRGAGVARGRSRRNWTRSCRTIASEFDALWQAVMRLAAAPPTAFCAPASREPAPDLRLSAPQRGRNRPAGSPRRATEARSARRHRRSGRDHSQSAG